MDFAACIAWIPAYQNIIRIQYLLYEYTHIFAITNVWIVDDASEVLICFRVMYVSYI